MKRSLFLLLLACATTEGAKKPSSPCPAKPSCLTEMRCSYDPDRGCDICVCQPPMIERGAEPGPGQPPFQR